MARASLPNSGGSVGRSKAVRQTGGIALSFETQALFTSAQGHFFLFDSTSGSSEAELSSLASALEEAYDQYQQLGFSYAQRTSWPLVVDIKDLDESVFGYHNTSLFGLNFHTISINASKMSDLKEAGSTGFHEFFHFVQYLYDPRGNWDRAKKAPPHHWVNEASAAWIETYYSLNGPNHQSTVFNDNADAIRSGAEYGAHKPSPGGDHGYGMAGLFKYGVTNLFTNGPNSVADIYAAILSGEGHIEAILQQIPEAKRDGGWWKDFSRSFSSGGVYSVTARQLIDAARFSHIHKVQTPDDLVPRTFSHFANHFFKLFPDLSNDYFQLRIQASSAVLNTHIAFFDVDNLNGDPELNMYTTPQSFLNQSSSAILTHWVSNPEAVIVADLKSVAETKTNLVAEVVNATFDSPFDHLNLVLLDLSFRVVIFRFVNSSNQFIHILLPEEPFVREINRLDANGGCRCTYLDDGAGGIFSGSSIQLRAGFNGNVLRTANVNLKYTDSFVGLSDPLLVTATFDDNLKVSYTRYDARVSPCNGCGIQGDLFPPN